MLSYNYKKNKTLFDTRCFKDDANKIDWRIIKFSA